MNDAPEKSPLSRVDGRAIAVTALRLGIASLIVGGLLAVLRIDPIEMWQTLWRWVTEGVAELFDTGIEGVALVITLVATGAVIVIPIWIVSKLLSARRR